MSAVAVAYDGTCRDEAAARAELARSVLTKAEERTGAHRRWDPTAEARARAHGVRTRPADPLLAALLPTGLDRGTTLTVTGSTSLVLGLLAQASAGGSWVAVVGLPTVGVLAAHQLGLALDRVVLVPDPGPDGPRVLAALVDGVDAVVAGEVALADADRRRISARARERGSVLVSTTPWPGSSVVLTVEGSRWSGVGRGEGRLRDRVLTVSRYGRGAAGRGWRGQVRLGARGPVPLEPARRVDLAGARDGVSLELGRAG
ncbi:MAG TPA: hypothetical protein PKB06_06625 [Actinotalea sp.]|nr:hypothetical protein [Actinotalea sp.]